MRGDAVERKVDVRELGCHGGTQVARFRIDDGSGRPSSQSIGLLLDGTCFDPNSDAQTGYSGLRTFVLTEIGCFYRATFHM